MLEGPAKVSVDEAGDVIVEMTSEPYSFQMTTSHYHRQPKKKGRGVCPGPSVAC